MNDSLKRLQQGLHHDPFELLGRHPHVDGGWIIRVDDAQPGLVDRAELPLAADGET